MTAERLLRIPSEEFRDVSDRLFEVTALTSRLNVLPFEDDEGKVRLLGQILGRPLPPDVAIYPPFFTDYGRHLEFSGKAFINQNCTFLDYFGISIGERVMVAPRATFITIGHPIEPAERWDWLVGGPIDIADDVWIGAGATILPGVTIGRGAVVGAGAVISSDVPPATLVAGSKATAVRSW